MKHLQMYSVHRATGRLNAMAQVNLHVTDEFAQDLEDLMRLRELRTKSEAIRLAVREAAIAVRKQKEPFDFEKWRGLALKFPEQPKPRFLSDDDLWKKDHEIDR